MNSDHVSLVVARAIDVLFVQNPRGTSFGAVCGVAAKGIIQVLGGIAEKYAELSIFYFIAAGIALANIPAMVRNRRELPREFEDALEMTRRAETVLSKAQIRMQYMALISEAAARTKSQGAPPIAPAS